MPSASLPGPAETDPRGTGVVLVAHGSRHEEVGAALDEQCRLLAAELADRGIAAAVAGGFLDHATPSATEAAQRLAADRGCHTVVLLPHLLTAAFHVSTDLPQLAADLRGRLGAAVDVVVAPHLGSHPTLLSEARERVRDAVGRGVDALVVALTGTRDMDELEAQRTIVVEGLAPAVGEDRIATTVLTATGPRPAEALASLRDRGAVRPAWLSWSLLPGTLERAGRAEAVDASADLVDLGRLGPSRAVAVGLADRLQYVIEEVAG